MSFADLGLAPELLANLQRLKYTVATPIQTAAIPLILDGHDVLGCAQTGTGKTAAFSLPILQQLVAHVSGAAVGEPMQAEGRRSVGQRGESEGKRGRATPQRSIAALILTPTRELATQIAESFSTYGRNLGLRQAVIFGGVSANPQMAQLRGGVDIVVATPGRLLDLMGQGVVDLSRLRVLVLDEADQMLDMGFIQPLKRIVSRIPRERQTLMFSATMPPEIQRLAEQWLQDPQVVQANVVARPPDKIRQSVAFVDQKRKIDALIEFVRQSAGIRQIVFCRTKHGADRVAKQLGRVGISAVAIHGNKSQNARQRALASFSSEEPPILVATDVAARGLHMPGVSHVINFDLPSTPETYVHRIGRTARAGASGESISFCSPDERDALRDIERLIGHSIAIDSLTSSTMAGGAGAARPSAAVATQGTKTPARKASRPAAPAKKSRPSRPPKQQRRTSGSEPNARWEEVGAPPTRRSSPRREAPRPSQPTERSGAKPRPNAEPRSRVEPQAAPNPRGSSGPRPLAGPRPASRRTASDSHPSFGSRTFLEQRRNDERPAGQRPARQRPAAQRSASQRTADERPAGQRPTGQRPTGQRSAGERPTGQRPAGQRRPGQRPAEQRSGEPRSRSSDAARPRGAGANGRPRRRQTD